MKPKYAPELEKLLIVKDGSIDDNPKNILQNKNDKIKEYVKRSDEFTASKAKSSYNKTKKENNTFKNYTKNVFKELVEDIKKELTDLK